MMTSIRRADIEWKVAVSEGSTEVWKWTSGPSAMETSETHLEYSVECWIGRSYAMRAWVRDVRVFVCCDQNEQRVLSQVVVSSSILENDHLKKEIAYEGINSKGQIQGIYRVDGVIDQIWEIGHIQRLKVRDVLQYDRNYPWASILS